MSRLFFSRVARAVAGLAALALLAAPGAARAASKNLLINPDFEERLPGHPWMPAGWDTSVSGLPTTFFGSDTFVTKSGRFSVNVANVSTLLPMAHNWSQSMQVGREAWGKDLKLTVWTRSNGVEGRAYVLLQAYRDTISKMAHVWKIPRDEAATRLGINKVDDPLVDLGWKREIFIDHETEWVQRELRLYCPPGVNMVYVRAGVLGTGQLIIDDASLTLENPLPAPPAKQGVNLLADGDFEGDWTAWEYGLPPYAGILLERDSVDAHQGKNCVRFSHVALPNSPKAPTLTRIGICQVVSNRNLGGKKVRLSAWMRTDSLRTSAYLKLFAHGLYGDVQGIASHQITETRPWTATSQELDLPPDTYQVWAWCQFDGPSPGRVYFDDVSLEVVGNATLPPKPKPSKSAAKQAGKRSDAQRN